jgi:hypothetical protein
MPGSRNLMGKTETQLKTKYWSFSLEGTNLHWNGHFPCPLLVIIWAFGEPANGAEFAVYPCGLFLELQPPNLPFCCPVATSKVEM